MKKLMALLLALMMTLSLVACGGGESEGSADAPASNVEAGLLRVAALYDITTMDVAQTTDNYMVPMNIFDRLFEVEVQKDGSTEIVGSLCESYSVSDDGLTYTFKLRDGVVFSNGSGLEASDVQYTFERLLTAGGVNDDIPLEVLGAEELKSGAADTLAGFKVTSDVDFSITLAAPNAGFIAELTGPAMSIVDRETMAEVQNFGIACEDTIGTGPYKITEWVVNDHYTLEYNDKYWGEAPSVKKMVVSIIPDASTQNLMYQNGELDILDLEYLDSAIVESTYKTAYADRIISGSRVGLTYLAMNANHEYLSDVKVRKAVQMAVDVDTIVASVYAGDAIVENGIIPTGVWGHNDQLQRPAYSVENAKKLLADAGYAEGEVKFELAMDSSSSSNTQLVYQLIQQQLKDAGILVEIKPYDESSWLDLRKSGEMDAFIANWTMDYNDPANIMYTFYGSAEKTKLRSLNYADEEIMARVAAASGITDDAERMAEYQALEKKIVEEDAAWVPLLGNMHLFALGERVESFVPYWAGYSNFYAKDVQLG
ncbi:MAG: ABC transporter substrate-binding protein [Oscillospiraceae bacterium]|nr:ABC transporter substrate-binding protein [Oscillospiraceae bacterium]